MRAGQHEIDFKYAEALTAANDIVTFKLAVKTIAQKHKLHAHLMPKPLFGVAGNGMHTNMSLFKDGKNAFYDPDKAFRPPKRCSLSPAYWIMPGPSAVANPLVNSYKRLVPGYEAPVYIAWSARNRSPLVASAARGNSTRVELARRTHASTRTCCWLWCFARAWMAFSVVFAAPPDPVDGSVHERR